MKEKTEAKAGTRVSQGKGQQGPPEAAKGKGFSPNIFGGRMALLTP